jgi:hypothetical protein
MVGNGWVSRSDFWKMHPQECWLIVEHKKQQADEQKRQQSNGGGNSPPKIDPKERAELIAAIKEANSQKGS